MADDEDSVRLPLLYTGIDDTPVVLANQFVGQIERDTFILVVGQMTPPILIGTPEERRAQALQLSYVPVKTVGRYAMTKDRLAELVAMLSRQLAVMETQIAEEDDHAG
jgi:hypothetical protein